MLNYGSPLPIKALEGAGIVGLSANFYLKGSTQRRTCTLGFGEIYTLRVHDMNQPC